MWPDSLDLIHPCAVLNENDFFLATHGLKIGNTKMAEQFKSKSARRREKRRRQHQKHIQNLEQTIEVLHKRIQHIHDGYARDAKHQLEDLEFYINRGAPIYLPTITLIRQQGTHDQWCPGNGQPSDRSCDCCGSSTVWKYGKDIFPNSRYSAAESAYRMCQDCGTPHGQSIM
jgi:hypothetical protein